MDVEVTIDKVDFKCKVKGNTTSAKATIYYKACGVSFEYRSLARYVRKIAASAQWSAEDLAQTLAKLLSSMLRTAAACSRAPAASVVVRLEFAEEPGLMVKVEAHA